MKYEFPPRTRGWTLARLPRSALGIVSPAHAGMDPQRQGLRGSRPRFPRARGDGPPILIGDCQHTTFPPRTRGWTRETIHRITTRAVSPAHAGMDPTHTRPLWRIRRFPRARGDGPRIRRRRLRSSSFPPRTRGWTLFLLGLLLQEEVSPAHAGMDLYTCRPGSADNRFPRARGDGP